MKTPRLHSQIVPVPELPECQRLELFKIFARHYEHVTWPQFASDLAEKDYVIVLSDAESGVAHGFSTQQILRTTVRGVSLRAIFSGDTIIDRAYWGEQELVRSWCRFAGQVRAAEPQTPLFWFLISKGYRTYLFLPLFYREFFPRFDTATPAFEKAVMDALALHKFPEFYRAESGLIEFPESHGQLTAELAEIPPGRRHHPQVQFFLSRNPGYARGTELVCLAEISPDNMKSFAAAAVREGMQTGPLPEPAQLHYA